MLAKAVGPDIEDDIRELLEPMLAVGLRWVRVYISGSLLYFSWGWEIGEWGGFPTTGNFPSYGTQLELWKSDFLIQRKQLIVCLWPVSSRGVPSREWEVLAQGSEVHFNLHFFTLSGIQPEFLQNRPLFKHFVGEILPWCIAENDPLPKNGCMNTSPPQIWVGFKLAL
jgi:hypothetical protein